MRSTAVECPTPELALQGVHVQLPQMLFFRAETAKAFTTVLAFMAFTWTTLPNISLFPAGVAFFNLVLIITNPGRTNFPDFHLRGAPMSARAFRALMHSDFFRSVAPASDSAIPVLDILVDTAFFFMAFMAFIAPM